MERIKLLKNILRNMSHICEGKIAENMASRSLCYI
jgi:hypothetical protein